MEYRDHPLLSGFKDQPDQVLLDCAISQLEMAAWIAKGANPKVEGLAPGISDAIRDGFQSASRPALEKFLYYAIRAAVKASQESRGGKDPTIPSAAG